MTTFFETTKVTHYTCGSGIEEAGRLTGGGTRWVETIATKACRLGLPFGVGKGGGRRKAAKHIIATQKRTPCYVQDMFEHVCENE